MIDLCIIATLRPELLERTLESFVKHVDISLIENVIINIDLVGGNLVDSHHIELLVDKFLKKQNKKSIKNTKPNFAKAVKNVWALTSSDCVFHLEEDWEFLKDVSLDFCAHHMIRKQDYIRIPKVGAAHLNTLHKVALQPSLWRGDLCRELARHMETYKDPEKQLRIGQGNNGIDNALKDIHIYDHGNNMVKDIGREWRKNHNLDKWNKNNSGEITWQKKS